jgi:hypothetical protein
MQMVVMNVNTFQDRHHKPLGHPSIASDSIIIVQESPRYKIKPPAWGHSPPEADNDMFEDRRRGVRLNAPP